MGRLCPAPLPAGGGGGPGLAPPRATRGGKKYFLGGGPRGHPPGNRFCGDSLDGFWILSPPPICLNAGKQRVKRALGSSVSGIDNGRRPQWTWTATDLDCKLKRNGT